MLQVVRLCEKAYENSGFLTPKRNATARFTSSETIQKVPNVPSEISCCCCSATAAAAAAAPAAAAANVAAGTTLLQKAYENSGFLTPKRNATARFTSSETRHRKVPNVPSEIPLK